MAIYDLQGSALQDLASYLREAYTTHTSEEQFKEAKRDKMASYAENTQVAIVLGMERHAGKIPAEEEVMAVACAVQNLHLSAAAEGLGGFWSTAPVYDIPEVRSFFGFAGEDDRYLGIFYIGYPKNEWPERKRLLLSQFWIKSPGIKVDENRSYSSLSSRPATTRNYL